MPVEKDSVVTSERYKRLFPNAFAYRNQAAGKPGGYPIEQDRTVRYDKTTILTHHLNSIHGPVVFPVKQPPNKTWLESHNWYADEIRDAEAGKPIEVLYSLPRSTRWAHDDDVINLHATFMCTYGCIVVPSTSTVSTHFSTKRALNSNHRLRSSRYTARSRSEGVSLVVVSWLVNWLDG